MIQDQKYTKAILDNSPECIVLIGLNHEILAFNKTMQLVLRQYFNKEIQVGELYYPSYVVDSSKQLYTESFNKAIKGERVNVQQQTKGENFSAWFEYRVVPVFDDENKLFGVSLSAKNIDNEKTAEEEIKKLNEFLENKVRERTHELQQSNQELDAFNHTISHDLRQPITGVKHVLSSFSEKYATILDDKGKEGLQIMSEALEGMDLLVKELLNFSKWTKKELFKERVDMFKLINEICNEIKLGNGESTPDIIVNQVPEANCDPLLIKQVWMNLISNAIKYSSKKKDPIIEIFSYSNAGETVYVIRDNGIGFDMEHSEKLFLIFERLDKKREFDGSGIGLTIAHRIVNRHGGRIWAESEKHRGATFYFTLNP
jgi:PAS domain S-box-containing protein